jgi:hypothetical protein
MVLLLVIALVLGFTIVVPLEPNQVIRKSIKVVQIPLVVFASIACATYFEPRSRPWLRIIGVGVILAGCLTLGTDIFQYVDLETQRSPETTYISPGKMDALEWIRKNTAPAAIVQLLDEVRPDREFNDTHDLSITALGERRTLFANYKLPYLLQVSSGDLSHRIRILEEVFVARDPGDLRTTLDRLPAHYLLVDAGSPGPLDAVRRLTVSGYMREVFRAGEVCLLVKSEGAPPSAVGTGDSPGRLSQK